MKSKLKRAVSLIVALAMSLSLMSVGAFAADIEYVEVEKTAVLEAELFIEDDGSIFAALPEDAPEGAEAVAWHSSDETVALIDGDGVITLVGEGETDITVTVKYLETVAVPVKEEVKVEPQPKAEAEEQGESETKAETIANNAAEETAPDETAEPAESGEGESAIEIPDDYSTMKAGVEKLFEGMEPVQTADESPAPVSEESAPVVEEAAAQASVSGETASATESASVESAATEEAASVSESADAEQPSEEPIVVEATSVQNAARPLKASAVGNTLTVTSLTAADDDAWKSKTVADSSPLTVWTTENEVSYIYTMNAVGPTVQITKTTVEGVAVTAEKRTGNLLKSKSIAYALYYVKIYEDENGQLLAGGKTVTKVESAGDTIYSNASDEGENASITLSETSLSLVVGTNGVAYNTVFLSATKTPAYAVVTWESSDESVATVSDGIVTPKREGSATITATISGGDVTASATCTVTVEAKDLSILYPVYVEYTGGSANQTGGKSNLAGVYKPGAGWWKDVRLVTINESTSEVLTYAKTDLHPNEPIAVRIKNGVDWTGYIQYADGTYKTERTQTKTEGGYTYYTYKLTAVTTDEAHAVAKVGDNYYSSLAVAVDVAKSETQANAGTVVLLDSSKLGGTLTIDATTSHALTGNCANYSGNSPCYVTIDATQMTGNTALNIVPHGYVTLNATGKTLGDVTVNNSGAASSFLTVNGGAYGKLTIGGGYETEATVNNATFNGDVLVKGTHSTSSGSWHCYARLYVNDGAVFNGTVTLDNGGAEYQYNHDTAHPGALIVTGGTFNGNVDIQFAPDATYEGYDTSAGKALSAKGALDESTHTGGLVNITGGTFASDVGAWVAEGYVQSASGAVVKAEDLTYTVRFVSEGTVLSVKTYRNGTEAASVVAPANPTKTADAQNTYTFKGWDKPIASVTSDATYTAVFEAAAIVKTAENTTVTTDTEAGTTTTTVTTGEGSSIATTVNAAGEVTKVVETNGSTTITTENTKGESNKSNALGIDTASETTTVATVTDGSASAATVEETKKEVKSESVTVDGTTAAKYTFTVTTEVKTGTTADSANTAVDTSKTEVSVAPKTSEAKVTVTDNNTAANAAKTAANKASNVIATENISTAVLSEKLTTLAEQKAETGKDVQVDVALTLETTLTGYTGDEGNSKATSLTYEVKPVLTTTVKVEGQRETTTATENIENSDLTGDITVKLPIPNTFYSAAVEENGKKFLYVNHSSDGYADTTIKAEVKGTADNYYVEFTVTHFSSFQIVDPSSKVIVTFDSASGSSVAAQTIDKGTAVSAPAAPTRSGYTFAGWTLNDSAYNFSSLVNENITLVASWTQNRTSTPTYYGGGGGGSTAPAQQQETIEIGDGATPLAALPSAIASVTVNGETYILADVELPYADVAADSWFHDAAAYMTVTGIMNGTGEGFSPNTATSGSMAAAMLYRMATGESTSGATWADAPLAWVEENALTEGIGFTASETATREQLVTMLYRLAEAQGYDVSAEDALAEYPDAEGLSEFADKAMRWAVAVGIINGMDGKLNAGGSVTRAQIATMMMRFCELTDAFV